MAKAAELAPGSVKANANLAVWALLRNDPGMAEQIMRSAALPDTARQEVQRLAQQLRQPPVARATALPPAGLLAAETPASHAPSSTGTPRATRADARLAPSMLERFGASHHANESTP